jgi:protein tyrosine/serine phosphatase
MPLNNFGVVGTSVRRIYRHAQPDEVGFADLSEIGVATIFKLCEDGEYPDAKESLLFKKYRPDNEVILYPFPEVFRFGQIDRVKECAKEIYMYAHNGLMAVSLHCSHGRDRTGLIAGAVKLLYLGAKFAEVEADRKIFGANEFYDLTVDAPDIAILKEIAKSVNAL